MSSTESVSMPVDTPVEQPSIEEQAAAVGLNPDGSKKDIMPADGVSDSSPILGKFQSVEDLAKAYSELEKKLGSGEIAPAKTVSDEGLKITNAPDPADDVSSTSPLGNMDALLEAGTISQEVYDTYIAGQQAATSAFNAEVYNAAGGEAEYNDLITWAADNLSEAEIDTFNNLLEDGNVSAVKLAVSGLAAQRGTSQAQEPARNIAGGTPPSADVFQNWAQVQEAMNDPRYYKDAAYNAAVVEKIGRSNI